MRVLLDTHTLLWFAAGSPKLSVTALDLLEGEHSEAVLSVASLWEIAIKVSVGRLHLGGDYNAAMAVHLQKADAALLPISLSHCAVVAGLPYHHRDPFDRLIAAQALAERIPLLSADTAFDAYGVERIW